MEASLLLLLNERGGYGYDLAAALQERGLVSGGLPPARVYEALRRLEAEGAVTSTTEQSPSGPERHRYLPTRIGRERLARWAETLVLTQATIGRFLLAYESRGKEVVVMQDGCGCGQSCGCHGHSPMSEMPERIEEPKPPNFGRARRLSRSPTEDRAGGGVEDGIETVNLAPRPTSGRRASRGIVEATL